MKPKITRKRKHRQMKNKQTNKRTKQSWSNKNKEITAKAENLLDLRVSVHGGGRNCSARDLTGSPLLEYSNVYFGKFVLNGLGIIFK